MSAYAMAATVDFGLDAKQGLLDLRSENARLRLVTRLFRAAIKRLDFVDRAQARARSNGTRPARLSCAGLRVRDAGSAAGALGGLAPRTAPPARARVRRARRCR